MERIDSLDKAVDLFGTGKHGFTEGSPPAIPATTLSGDWCNSVQEEIAGAIEHTGIALNPSSMYQLVDALAALFAWHAVGNMREAVNAKAYDLNAICYSEDLGLWVAVGDSDGTDSYILTSPNGITWTERAPTASKTVNLYGVAAGNGLVIAVGQADGADAYILTTSDGITWTERSNPQNLDLNAICYSEDISLWVAVGNADGTDAYIVTSSDGSTWTERANPATSSLQGVCVGNSLIVAVGNDTAGHIWILSSENGTSWTDRGISGGISLKDVCYSADKETFVAVGGTAGGYYFSAVSTDGLSWTLSYATAGDRDLLGVCCGNGVFVASGEQDGTEGTLLTSYDGVNWSKRHIRPATSLNGAGFGNGLFITVGDDDGSDASILYSSDIGTP